MKWAGIEARVCGGASQSRLKTSAPSTKPDANGKVVSVEFAGKDHDMLYVAGGEKIYGRKVKVKGYFGK